MTEAPDPMPRPTDAPVYAMLTIAAGQAGQLVTGPWRFTAEPDGFVHQGSGDFVPMSAVQRAHRADR
jgi:hypothetical protein